MKIKGKHIAITAGLSAVLALSPVVTTVSSAFATTGGAAQQTEAPAARIDVTFSYDGTTWTVPADENGNIPADIAAQLPEGYTWTWTDAQGNAHEFGSNLLASYIFTQSCTVTGTAPETEEPSDPAAQIDVTFSYDGTTVATVADENGKIPADIAAQLPEGYTWTWTDAQGNAHEFGSDLLASYIFTESCTVTGTAPAPEQRYITVHFMDGDEEISTGAVLNGTSDWSGVTNPTKDGYTFAGWNFEGETTLYQDLDTVAVAYDSSITEINLYANWTKDEEVPFERYIDVNYWDGDKLLGTGQVLNGTTQWSGIVSPTKDGYTFAGWNFEGETATYPDLDVVRAAYDATIDEINVYANWTENEAPAPEQRYIDVNYWDGDQLLGTGAVLNGTSDWSGVVSPTKDGYTFAGWQFEGESTIYTDAELDGVVIAADESVTEINLYAQWDEVVPEQRYIDVNYWDGDQLLGTGAVLNGTNQWSGIVNPTKDGYTFAGWQFEGEDTVTSDLDKVVFAGDASVTEINLYAQWNKVVDPETKFYTVTFDDCLANTENLTVEVEEGKTVLKPIDPTCAGWKFEGWFTDTALTQAYDFDAPVTADLTLYAKWSQVEGAGETEGAVTPTKPEDKGGLPQTGDIAAIATAAVAVAGAGIAGAGALINKRRK